MTPLFFLVFFFVSSPSEASISKSTKIMNSILDPRIYDARVRPNEGSRPVTVNINFFISSMNSISESNMEFTMDIFLRQKWVDARLEHTHPKPIIVPPKSVDKIWYSDLFFSNEKRGNLHKITQPNTYIRIKGTGEVLLSQRFTLTLSCSMELSMFPFDSQKCGIEMESYGYNMDDVVFRFPDEDPVQVREETTFPSHVLDNVETIECTKSYNTTGRFTCIGAKFTFKREIGFFLFNVFAPSFASTALSWLGFWLSPSAAPARVIHGALCLVSSIGFMNAAKEASPKVAYMVAMDIWMVVSLVFIVLSMLETAYVLWLYHKGDEDEKEEEKIEPGSRRKRSYCNWKGCANKVDVLSRILIPALYIGWSAFYWSIYIGFSKNIIW